MVDVDATSIEIAALHPGAGTVGEGGTGTCKTSLECRQVERSSKWRRGSDP